VYIVHFFEVCQFIVMKLQAYVFSNEVTSDDFVPNFVIL